MKLTFLGTRGNIEARTRLHDRHSVLQVSYRGRRVIIDWGEDWRGRSDEVQPRAILVTHAHPDHAFGLEEGAGCPVYATAAAWEEMNGYPVEGRRMSEREPTVICGMTFEAFPVEHSTRAPAVGYRIAAGRVRVFYVPDVVYIHDRSAALAGVAVYIGDGATLTRSLVRKSGDALIGHAPVRTQLGWCRKEGVPRAIFTHCGSEIVRGDERRLAAALNEMAAERGVRAEIAHDRMEVLLR